MSSYSDPSSQGSMLFDSYRNQFYYDALKAVITPDSVVLDLGAGLGGFGLMAAKLGAKAVYLVDPSPAIYVAEQAAKANGIVNVQCFHDTIERVELPSKVDIIISVFTGNFMLSEDLLPSLFYARDKYLLADGQLIPNRAEMIAAPVQIDQFYERSLASWYHNKNLLALGLDYQVAQKYAVNRCYHDNFRNLQPKLLSSPQVLTALDFKTATRAECFSSNSFSCEQEGDCHGWLGWFRMQLGEQWMSTGPEAPASHWSQVLLPLETTVEIKPDEKLSLDLKRPQYGDYSWQTGGKVSFKQSTFLSRPMVPKLIIKQSDAYKPQLNDSGAAMQFVLAQFEGDATLVEISAALRIEHSKTFKTDDAAKNFVKSLAASYS